MPRTPFSWRYNRFLSQDYRAQPTRFADLPEQSLLKIFGYSTGINASNGSTRIQILQEFLYTELPVQWPGRAAWHEAGSLARLYRMVSHIEWAADMMERDHRRDCSDAVSQRRADAQWLLRHAPGRWALAM
jgi:hypothetical protein